VPWRLRKFRNYSSVEKNLCLLWPSRLGPTHSN
jgi:hypothetical protein